MTRVATLMKKNGMLIIINLRALLVSEIVLKYAFRQVARLVKWTNAQCVLFILKLLGMISATHRVAKLIPLKILLMRSLIKIPRNKNIFKIDFTSKNIFSVKQLLPGLPAPPIPSLFLRNFQKK